MLLPRTSTQCAVTVNRTPRAGRPARGDCRLDVGELGGEDLFEGGLAVRPEGADVAGEVGESGEAFGVGAEYGDAEQLLALFVLFRGDRADPGLGGDQRGDEDRDPVVAGGISSSGSPDARRACSTSSMTSREPVPLDA